MEEEVHGAAGGQVGELAGLIRDRSVLPSGSSAIRQGKDCLPDLMGGAGVGRPHVELGSILCRQVVGRDHNPHGAPWGSQHLEGLAGPCEGVKLPVAEGADFDADLF